VSADVATNVTRSKTWATLAGLEGLRPHIKFAKSAASSKATEVPARRAMDVDDETNSLLPMPMHSAIGATSEAV
jgi:hypothetical protein